MHSGSVTVILKHRDIKITRDKHKVSWQGSFFFFFQFFQTFIFKSRRQFSEPGSPVVSVHILLFRGTLNKSLCWKAPHQIQTFALLYTIFDTRGNLFVYLPEENSVLYGFYILTVQTLP